LQYSILIIQDLIGHEKKCIVVGYNSPKIYFVFIEFILDRRQAAAYDFVSTTPYLPDEQAALKVSRTKRFDEFTEDELSHLGPTYQKSLCSIRRVRLLKGFTSIGLPKRRTCR